MKNRILKLIVICAISILNFSCSNTDNQVNLELIPVKSGEKWGYVNKKGEYIINLQFGDAQFFRDGIAKVETTDGKVGYIDEKGAYVINASYKDGTPFKNGLAFVVSDGSYPTCIDNEGNVKFVLKTAKKAYWFTEDMAMFENEKGQFGFVDKTGKIIISPQFDAARPFNEGFAAICQKNKWGFIDKTGKIVINPQFEGVMDFYNGKAAFSNNEQCGFIDTKGAYIINPQFDYVSSFVEKMAIVYSGKNFGFINEEGKIDINPQFEEVNMFSCDLASIKQNDKWGFIDKTGKIMINPQFDEASSFYDDIAFIKIGDKYGIIDKEGKYIVNPQFDYLKSIIWEDYLKVNYNFYDGLVPSVKSDFYNTVEFTKQFLNLYSNKIFDGLTPSTILQNIVDNPKYGEYLNTKDEFTAYSNKSEQITNEISISETEFYFTKEIYSLVSDGWWGTQRQYNLSSNLSYVNYKFNLIGEAEDKGSAIANALQTEIGKRFNCKFENKDQSYIAIQDDGKISLLIEYTDYSIMLYVSFSKDKINEILTSKEESNEE